MKVDMDTKERIKIILLFFLQSYKVVMGSMLVVFVPRECVNGNITDVCSVQDNIYNNDDILNSAALSTNFLTIFFFFLTYLIELRRENFCVHNFDIDHDVGDNNLAIILKDKPKLLTSLHYHNKMYYRVTMSTVFVFLINFIVSDIVLYDDPTFWKVGIAPYMSYIVLILMKLYNCYYIASHSIENDKALSSYMTEFSSFNVIDIDMLDDHEKIERGEKTNDVLGPFNAGLGTVINTVL